MESHNIYFKRFATSATLKENVLPNEEVCGDHMDKQKITPFGCYSSRAITIQDVSGAVVSRLYFDTSGFGVEVLDPKINFGFLKKKFMQDIESRASKYKPDLLPILARLESSFERVCFSPEMQKDNLIFFRIPVEKFEFLDAARNLFDHRTGLERFKTSDVWFRDGAAKVLQHLIEMPVELVLCVSTCHEGLPWEARAILLRDSDPAPSSTWPQKMLDRVCFSKELSISAERTYVSNDNTELMVPKVQVTPFFFEDYWFEEETRLQEDTQKCIAARLFLKTDASARPDEAADFINRVSASLSFAELVGNDGPGERGLHSFLRHLFAETVETEFLASKNANEDLVREYGIVERFLLHQENLGFIVPWRSEGCVQDVELLQDLQAEAERAGCLLDDGSFPVICVIVEPT